MNDCACDLRTRLIGDGCSVCNPTLALECADETIAELRAVNAELLEAVKELSTHALICGHMMNCGKRFAASPEGGVCTCGLNEILARSAILRAD